MTSRSAIVIEPRRGVGDVRLSEAWRARGLLGVLIWRDLTVRYKQTLLGLLWAFLQPALTAAVFTLLFGRLAGIASDGVPYALFSYVGLVLWTYFAQGVTLASNSLVGAAHIITKIYFPRVFLPAAAVFSGLVDLAVAGSLIGVVAALFRYPLRVNLTLVLLSVSLAVVVTLSTALWLSSLNVLYRDVRFVVPFLVQLWLFLTPVIYPTNMLATRFEARGIPVWLIGLNPMVGAVEGIRSGLFTGGFEATRYLLVGWAVAIIGLLSGLVFFRRTESRFSDVV